MTGEYLNYSEVYRLEPGAVIPVREWPPIILESTANGFDVHGVLNTIGSAVEDELTWDWPPPYDGEARRASVRIREKCRRYERSVVWPWQETLLALRGVDRLRVVR